MQVYVSDTNPSIERPSGRMELRATVVTAVCRHRPFVNGFAAKDYDHACEPSQSDRNLRGDTKRFARFHYKRVRWKEFWRRLNSASQSPNFAISAGDKVVGRR